MEKKNTMLLTVIAVATLLVAVVGATFAYYSVTGNTESATRTVTTTTPKLGSVSLTDSDKNLYLKISGDQMANTADARKTYYHQESDTYADTNSNRWTKVANIVAQGGENDTTYSCKFNYTVVTDGTMTTAKQTENPEVNALTAADATIQLRATRVDGSTYKIFTLPLTGTPATAITTTTGAGLSGEIQFQVTGDTSYDIEAQATFNTDRLQNDLAEKSMETRITFNNLRCYTGESYPD